MSRIRNKDMEYLLGRMVVNIKESGMKVDNTVLEW